MTVTSVHYVTGQQCHLSTGGDIKVRRGATMWRLRGVQLVELRCCWLCEGVIIATLGGLVFGTHLFSVFCIEEFLLNRSGITEGPVPVFKSRPIWGQRN